MNNLKSEVLMKKNAVISIGLLAVVILSSCGVVNDLSKVSATGSTFMTAMRDVDLATSWNMLAPSLQNEIGDRTLWSDWASPRNFESWTFSNTEINNDKGQIDGEATIGNEVYTITLVFQKISEEWKVTGINIVFDRTK
jgi:hypothetical protein